MKRYICKQYSAHDTKQVTSVAICDTAGANNKPVVQFYVSAAHGYEEQKARVLEYCGFLNMQDDAMKKAAGEITIASAVAQRMTKTP